jgi:hypothetical protein
MYNSGPTPRLGNQTTDLFPWRQWDMRTHTHARTHARTHEGEAGREGGDGGRFTSVEG